MPSWHREMSGRIEPCNDVIQACSLSSDRHYESQASAMMFIIQQLKAPGVDKAKLATQYQKLNEKTREEKIFEAAISDLVDNALGDDETDFALGDDETPFPLNSPALAAEQIFRAALSFGEQKGIDRRLVGKVSPGQCLFESRSELIRRSERYTPFYRSDPETGELYADDPPDKKALREYHQDLLDEFDVRVLWKFNTA